MNQAEKDIREKVEKALPCDEIACDPTIAQQHGLEHCPVCPASHREAVVSLMLEQRRRVIEESHAAFQDEYCKHEHMAIGMMRGLAAIRALAAGEGNAE